MFIINLLLLVVGFILLIKGANLFVKGSSNIAHKLKIPTFIIGLTIVAIGTSLPEFAVSVMSAINYKITSNIGDLSLCVGNVIGSNIFNLLFVIGFSCFISSIVVNKKILNFEIILLFISTILLLAFALLKELNLYSGLLFLIIYSLYIYILIRRSKKNNIEENNNYNISFKKAILILIIGITFVILGSQIVNFASKKIALSLGMSEELIGLTILAIGTSLPELVTSIVAMKQNENDIAIGNVVGSNIFNILFILGITSVISPISISSVFIFDIIYSLFTISIFTILILLTLKNGKISKKSGIVLILLYIIYMAYIIYRN